MFWKIENTGWVVTVFAQQWKQDPRWLQRKEATRSKWTCVENMKRAQELERPDASDGHDRKKLKQEY